MAKKNKESDIKKQELQKEILRHAHAMNLQSIEAYLDWCMQHRFSQSVKKTINQRNQEMIAYKKKTAINKLKQHKRESNLPYQIQQIYSKQIDYIQPDSESLLAIADGFKKSKKPKYLLEVLLLLHEKSKLLWYTEYVKGIINFVMRCNQWLRPINAWTPQTHNAQRQFSSLARHLFAKYEVPLFMDGVWQKGNEKAWNWYIHIGLGNNIRTAPSLPVNLTKKMAHHFIRAPSSYTVGEAFRWGQIIALGGNKRVADAVTETSIVRNFRDNAFWLSVLQFLINNPMLDTSQYNPIIDYIKNQKYDNRVEFIERGVVRQLPPAQPNFSMHGRSPTTLVRQMEDWHRRLGRENRGGDLQWTKSKISDFHLVEGKETSRNMKIWTIRELLSNKELITEGRSQNHCVSTYARSCKHGNTSIWTMDLQEKSGIHKTVTIEVNIQSKNIRQIRGKHNRLASIYEMGIISRWAVKEGLKIADYLKV